jgi:hypothetical protein
MSGSVSFNRVAIVNLAKLIFQSKIDSLAKFTAARVFSATGFKLFACLSSDELKDESELCA